MVSSLTPVAGDEHPARLVDPDLLDRRVVQEALQRTEPGHRVHDLLDRARHVDQAGQAAGQGPLVVVQDRVLHEGAHGRKVAHRVDAAPSDQLADLRLDDVHAVAHSCPLPVARHRPVTPHMHTECRNQGNPSRSSET